MTLKSAAVGTIFDSKSGRPEQRSVLRLGTLASAECDQHVQIRPRDRPVAGRGPTRSGTTRSTTSELATRVHRAPAVAKDHRAALVVPVVQHALEQVGVGARRVPHRRSCRPRTRIAPLTGLRERRTRASTAWGRSNSTPCSRDARRGSPRAARRSRHPRRRLAPSFEKSTTRVPLAAMSRVISTIARLKSAAASESSSRWPKSSVPVARLRSLVPVRTLSSSRPRPATATCRSGRPRPQRLGVIGASSAPIGVSSNAARRAPGRDRGSPGPQQPRKRRSGWQPLGVSERFARCGPAASRSGMPSATAAPIAWVVQLALISSRSRCVRASARARHRSGESARSCRLYSALIPASRTTLPHFACSARMNAANSSGAHRRPASAPIDGEPVAPFGAGPSLRYLRVQPRDDRLRRRGRRRDAGPADVLVAGHARFGDRRHLRQRGERVALLPRARAACPTSHAGSCAVSRPSTRRSDRRAGAGDGAAALVRHMCRLDAGGRLNSSPAMMRRRSDAGRAVGQGAGLGLGECDDSPNERSRHVRMHRQQQRALPKRVIGAKSASGSKPSAGTGAGSPPCALMHDPACSHRERRARALGADVAAGAGLGSPPPPAGRGPGSAAASQRARMSVTLPRAADDDAQRPCPASALRPPAVRLASRSDRLPAASVGAVCPCGLPASIVGWNHSRPRRRR